MKSSINLNIVDDKLKKIIIKYSVIISLFTFVVSKFFKKAIDEIVDVFLVIIFHIDTDKNGEPDLVQLQKYNIKILNINFSLGKLIYAILKLIFQILIVYTILIFTLKYTNLIKI